MDKVKTILESKELLSYLRDRLSSYPEYLKFSKNGGSFRGVIAGGAISNIIIEYIYKIPAQINDVDIFLDRRNKEGKNPYSDDSGYSIGSNFLIHDVTTKDILNIISLTSLRLEEGCAEEEFIVELLSDFDYNICQVGYEWKSGRLYFTEAFAKGLSAKRIELLNVYNPFKSLARGLQKREESGFDFQIGPIVQLCGISFYSSFMNARHVYGEDVLVFSPSAQSQFKEVSFQLGKKHIENLLKNKNDIEFFGLNLLKEGPSELDELRAKFLESLNIVKKSVGRRESRSSSGGELGGKEVLLYRNERLKYMFFSIELNKEIFEKRFKGPVMSAIIEERYPFDYARRKNSIQSLGFKFIRALLDGRENFQKRKIMLLDNLFSRDIFYDYENSCQLLKRTFDENKLLGLRDFMKSHVRLKRSISDYSRLYNWTPKQCIEFISRVKNSDDQTFVGFVESFIVDTLEDQQWAPKMVYNYLYQQYLESRRKRDRVLIESLNLDGFKYREWVLELDSTLKLEIEGEQMSHCVGGYTGSIKEGRSRIFSINFKGRRSTLEISVPRSAKNGWKVRQHRAKHNKNPHMFNRCIERRLLDYICDKNKI